MSLRALDKARGIDTSGSIAVRPDTNDRSYGRLHPARGGALRGASSHSVRGRMPLMEAAYVPVTAAR